MSLTDGGIQPTMPVQPANNYGGGMGMWGDNWIWIIVLFLFGWGRNGNGWGGQWQRRRDGRLRADVRFRKC